MTDLIILVAGLVCVAVTGVAALLAIGEISDRRQLRTSKLDRLADYLLLDRADDTDARIAIRQDPVDQAIALITGLYEELAAAHDELAAQRWELDWVTAPQRGRGKPRLDDWTPNRVYVGMPNHNGFSHHRRRPPDTHV